MIKTLSCAVCDRDAIDTGRLVRWVGGDLDLCLACVSVRDERALASACCCLDCLRHQQQHAA